jgi:predicted Zn finger-like uncharacterized protein
MPLRHQMLLSCPNCQTQYDVPDAALTGRSRTLRCDNCITQWKVPALEMYQAEPVAPAEVASFAAAEAVVDASQDDTETAVAGEPKSAAPEPAAADTKPSEPERVSLLKTSRIVQMPPPPEPSPARGLRTSFVIAVLIIVAILVAHRPISHFWPPSLRLYNALGLR